MSRGRVDGRCGQLTLAERDAWIRHLPGRDAAVAVPLVSHPDHGPTLVVSTRSTLNGRTGGRMSHAGDTVLLGGALEPGESPAVAAVRELREESGTAEVLDHRDFDVRGRLGRWITESGYAVEGFVVRAPAALALASSPDRREVSELFHIKLDEVWAASPGLDYHRVHVPDRSGVHGPAATGDWCFESPTLRVSDVHGSPRILWGAAGFMVTRLVELFPSPDAIFGRP